MTDGELRIVRLRDDFYRDGFYKIVTALLMMGAAILLLAALSFYLISKRPGPVVFATDNQWRAFPPVPVDQPYLQPADLLQWVSTVLPLSFTFDFLHYTDQLDNLAQYYTEDGLKKLNVLVDNFVSQSMVTRDRLYVQSAPGGAPVILNQGLLQGKYGWWVQIPINLTYTGVNRNNKNSIILQALVIRVPTLNNLSGVAIADLVLSKTTQRQNLNAQTTF